MIESTHLELGDDMWGRCRIRERNLFILVKDERMEERGWGLSNRISSFQ